MEVLLLEIEGETVEEASKDDDLGEFKSAAATKKERKKHKLLHYSTTHSKKYD